MTEIERLKRAIDNFVSDPEITEGQTYAALLDIITHCERLMHNILLEVINQLEDKGE